MKKSLIALSLISVFSAGAMASESKDLTFDQLKDVVADQIQLGKELSIRTRTTNIKINQKNAVLVANDIVNMSAEDRKGFIKFVNQEIRKGNVSIEDDANFNHGSNDWMPATITAEEVANQLDTAKQRLDSNKNTYIELTDGQGNTVGKIDSTNVDAEIEKFNALSDTDKVAYLHDIKAAAENGQIKEVNSTPEPTEPTIDDAMDWVNERINGAGGEVARAAAQYDARLDSLEANFNAMADRQLQQERRINTNEGKMSNGIAGVAAMANIPTVSGKTTFGAGVGHFNGSNALAIGASTGFENGISLKGSLSYAKGKWDQKDVVVGAGIGYSF